MGVQVCEQSEQKKMELNADIQQVMNSFEDFSMTCFKFPDISRFSRQVVILLSDFNNFWYKYTCQNLPSNNSSVNHLT